MKASIMIKIFLIFLVISLLSGCIKNDLYDNGSNMTVEEISDATGKLRLLDGGGPKEFIDAYDENLVLDENTVNIEKTASAIGYAILLAHAKHQCNKYKYMGGDIIATLVVGK